MCYPYVSADTRRDRTHRAVRKDANNSFENLIALCPTCHTRFDTGQINRQSMRQYKANLSVFERYSDLERRVIEHFVDNPQQDTIFLPGGLQLLLGYLVKDGLLKSSPALLSPDQSLRMTNTT